MTDRRIRIYPLPEAFVPGVPAVEMLLEPDEAEHLLAYQPPAFTRQRPKGQAAPDPDAPESPADVGLAEFPEDGNA